MYTMYIYIYTSEYLEGYDNPNGNIIFCHQNTLPIL